MDFQALIKQFLPAKNVFVVILAIIALSEYYISFSHFQYAGKKEDSPKNLNTAVVMGVLTLFAAVALTGLSFWVYQLK